MSIFPRIIMLTMCFSDYLEQRIGTDLSENCMGQHILNEIC